MVLFSLFKSEMHLFGLLSFCSVVYKNFNLTSGLLCRGQDPPGLSPRQQAKLLSIWHCSVLVLFGAAWLFVALCSLFAILKTDSLHIDDCDICTVYILKNILYWVLISCCTVLLLCSKLTTLSLNSSGVHQKNVKIFTKKKKKSQFFL
jgi:hypothetical protein